MGQAISTGAAEETLRAQEEWGHREAGQEAGQGWGDADTGCGEVACAGHQGTACDLSPTEERGRWEGPSPQRTLTHTGVHTCTGTPALVQACAVTQVCIPTQA